MRTQKKIAVTGGIGSGKSTVARMVKTCGFSVFSCDEIYRELMRSPEYIKTIGEIFPSAVTDCEIDKKRLAEIVFSDENAREKLNAVAHPWIMRNVIERMESDENALVFAEVPLLFEEHFENLFDEVWVVSRPLEARLRAASLRDSCTEEEIRRRIKTQFDYESNSAAAYFQKLGVKILRNDGTEKELREQVNALLFENTCLLFP